MVEHAPKLVARVVLAALVLSGVGCSPTAIVTESVPPTGADAGRDAGDAAADSAVFASDAHTLSGDGQTCTGAASMGITDFVSNSACYYDTSLKAGSTGTLLYDCNGGAAKLTIGPEVFTGTYDATTGTLALQEQRDFPFSDGCTWTSVQTIRGNLTKGTFQYGYQEHVASGTGCATACVASADITANVTPIAPPK